MVTFSAVFFHHHYKGWLYNTNSQTALVKVTFLTFTLKASSFLHLE